MTENGHERATISALALEAHETLQELKRKGVKPPRELLRPIINASWNSSDLRWLMACEDAAMTGDAWIPESAKEDWFVLRNSVLEKEDKREKKIKAPVQGVQRAREAREKSVIEIGNELSATLKTMPKYQSPEFKCIGDYDKCCVQRGETSVLCALTLFVCVARKLMPFAR
jgi:hypothetical protein